MSRSGYSDDLNPLDLGRWRAQVASSIRGKRGQRLLRDLAAALDAMPKKELIEGVLADGQNYCALGVLGVARGIDITTLEPDASDEVAAVFDITRQLACEVVFQNDERLWRPTPEERWKHMRNWVAKNIKDPK